MFVWFGLCRDFRRWFCFDWNVWLGCCVDLVCWFVVIGYIEFVVFSVVEIGVVIMGVVFWL